METFIYLPEEDKTFEAFFIRYKDLFTVDCEDWTNAKKVHLLLRKLGTTEYSKFVNYILPKTSELEFSEAVKLLSELFSPNWTLFHKRWKCFNLAKRDDKDYLTFTSIVNKHCDDFRLAELSADDFKCLIFAQGVVSAKNLEIRWRVLSKLESEPGLTLQKLAEDCQRLVSIKNNSKNIEESGVAYVRRTSYKPKNYAPWKSSGNKKYDQTQRKNRWPIQKSKLPTNPCSHCSGQHWSTNCFYQNKTCNECGKIDHKATHCWNKGNKKSDKQDWILKQKEIDEST